MTLRSVLLLQRLVFKPVASPERKITLQSCRGRQRIEVLLRPTQQLIRKAYSHKPVFFCSRPIIYANITCAGFIPIEFQALFLKSINRLRGREKKKTTTFHQFFFSNEIILTGICHGEAIPHLDHIHLRHQFGDVLVVREGEPKNLIFVRFGWEQSSCWAAKNQELNVGAGKWASTT